MVLRLLSICLVWYIMVDSSLGYVDWRVAYMSQWEGSRSLRHEHHKESYLGDA